ncbi:hypothetical protein [Mycoplasma sp. OR1901]|uniref:hypothetical protein n=1 Tax=Mycoplasma sp. OR1901 TaxID=2742195 RepID=UPI001582A4BE|nr:hypothetical protein [Mycoplasma sp. OR1901]QKT05561.1 hypothetical protein HTZ87_02495 [Mycoplasma sp. OR1901]
MEMVFNNYGLPKNVCSDRRSIMKNALNYETRFTKALREKGVELSSSSSPAFKPNVERLFKTAQSNYPLYFHSKNIKSIADLNNNAKEIIDFYNNKFKKSEKDKLNVFRAPNIEKLENKMILKLREKFIKALLSLTINY